MVEPKAYASEKKPVRGKYSKAYSAGHTVVIHNENGTTSGQYFKLEKGAILNTGAIKGEPIS